MAKKLRIGILFGGRSGEHEVSIVSALSVHKALDKNKYDVTLIGIDKEGRFLLPAQTQLLAHAENPRLIKLNKEKNNVSILPFPTKTNLISLGGGGAAQGFDVILPILHGTYGEDGSIQGLLELANIPYVGSGVLGSAVGMDKEIAKRIFRDNTLPIVPFITLYRNDFEKNPRSTVTRAIKAFGLPFFVKPANLGSSVGVHKVKKISEAAEKIADAFSYDSKIIIEKGLSVREIECAVLGNDEPQASVLGEVVPLHEFYSYEAKYIDANGANLFIPALLEKKLTTKIRTLALKAFKALNLRGMARVDFFIDKKNGRIYLNEVNTIPGFTPISMYPKLWEASGLPYPKLIDRLIELAQEQWREKNKNRTSYES